MDHIDEVLDSINESLSTLATAKAEGKSVDEGEIERLEKEKERAEQVKAAADTGTKTYGDDDLSELAELRARERDREERDMAVKAAKAVAQSIQQDESERQERIKGYAAEAVKEMLGGGVDSAVNRALGERRGSRFASEGAEKSLTEHIAAGGDTKTVDQHHAVAKGDSKSVQALMETKSVVRFMGAIDKLTKGMASDGEREWIQGIQAKALAEGTASSGGYLVPQEWMPDILGLLRTEAVVRRAGPRFVPFNKQMNQTSVSTGATAYYTAENATIAPSEETFGEAPLLTPHNLTGLVPVSNYLLQDAPQAEDFVRADLVEVMALREDLAFLRGTGSGGEPTGFRNMSGITLNPIAPGTNGFQITLGQTRRIKAVYRTLNARGVRLAWFFNPAFITYLETLVDTQGRFLAEANILQVNDDQMSGTFDGIPFYATNQLPANQTLGSSSNSSETYLVNMSEAIIGENMTLEIDVSREASYTPDGGTTWVSAFQNAQTLFRAIMRHDIAHRRPTQVVVQAGVLV